MEYCDRGDLEQHIKLTLKASTVIPESKIWKLLLQTAAALYYIHRKKIVHVDMKPSNILLHGKNLDVKLADFGISEALDKNYGIIHE